MAQDWLRLRRCVFRYNHTLPVASDTRAGLGGGGGLADSVLGSILTGSHLKNVEPPAKGTTLDSHLTLLLVFLGRSHGASLATSILHAVALLLCTSLIPPSGLGPWMGMVILTWDWISQFRGL